MIIRNVIEMGLNNLLGICIHLKMMCWIFFEIIPTLTKDIDDFEEFPEEPIDTGHIFNTDKKFKDRDELISEVKKTGLLHNINVRIDSYHAQRGFGEQWFKWDRSGSYQFRSDLDAPSTKSFTGSRKCDCPFKLKAVGQVDGTWKLYVHNGYHNHFIGAKLDVLNADVIVFESTVVF
ncbi:hypothetical protein RND81_03G136600 [Saponaria officinalis]|uniref:Uncharacterized protein n=1 Tax=Saponaria officinalis TaxID=3572 RepID=A0AAW1M099_SAPOF